jgi:hypothetical protein
VAIEVQEPGQWERERGEHVRRLVTGEVIFGPYPAVWEFPEFVESAVVVR